MAGDGRRARHAAARRGPAGGRLRGGDERTPDARGLAAVRPQRLPAGPQGPRGAARPAADQGGHDDGRRDRRRRPRGSPSGRRTGARRSPARATARRSARARRTAPTGSTAARTAAPAARQRRVREHRQRAHDPRPPLHGGQPVAGRVRRGRQRRYGDAGRPGVRRGPADGGGQVRGQHDRRHAAGDGRLTGVLVGVDERALALPEPVLGHALAPGETVTLYVSVDHGREPAGPWRARIGVDPTGAVVVVQGHGRTAPTPSSPDPTPPPPAPDPTPPPTSASPTPTAPTTPPPEPTPTGPTTPPPSPDPSPTDATPPAP